jgi:hypothetical protein
MDFWIWVLIIGGAVLSILGPLFWIVFAIFLANKASDVASVSSGLGTFGAGYGNFELDTLLAQLDQMTRRANAGAAQGLPGAAPGQQLTPQQQLEFQTMLMKAQNQMAQLDNLSQQRYETKMSGLTGYAAANGLDWTPGSF